LNETSARAPPRGCAGGRIGTRFLRPSSLKGVNPAGTPGYRNGTESFFGLKGRPSVVRGIYVLNETSARARTFKKLNVTGLETRKGDG
jgi:hypothetical protein